MKGAPSPKAEPLDWGPAPARQFSDTGAGGVGEEKGVGEEGEEEGGRGRTGYVTVR